MDREQQIEDFLMGTLSEQETKTFEKEMNQDAELKAAVEAALLSKVAIFKEGREEEVAKVLAQIPEHPRKATSNIWSYRWYAAAAVIVLLFVSYLFFPQTQRLGTQEIFAMYYEKQAAPQAKNSAVEDLLLAGHKNYNEANYSEAIGLYEAYLQQTLEDSTKLLTPSQLFSIYLYKGLSYTELDEYAEAIREFEQVDPKTESVEWYLALAYLQAGENQKARRIFQDIAQRSSHYKKQEVIEILESWDEDK